MTDAVIMITLLLTATFAFGMVVGTQIERSRRRRRDAQKEIDWMLESPPFHLGNSAGERPPPRIIGIYGEEPWKR